MDGPRIQWLAAFSKLLPLELWPGGLPVPCAGNDAFGTQIGFLDLVGAGFRQGRLDADVAGDHEVSHPRYKKLDQRCRIYGCTGARRDGNHDFLFALGALDPVGRDFADIGVSGNVSLDLER